MKTQHTANRGDDRGRSYRIANSGNIVVYQPAWHDSFGEGGRRIKIIARPLSEPNTFVARDGAHRDDISSAARILHVTIYRTTKVRGQEIFKG